MTIISASLLSANFAELKNELQRLDDAKADMIHLDVMDGHFVPNLTFGAGVIKSLRPYSNNCFDVHLMMSNPEQYIQNFADAGADIITIHAEAVIHLDSVLAKIKKSGCKAGVALNPATSPACLKYVLDKLDLILVMSVNPGFGGQEFIESSLDKIADIKKLVASKEILIAVDGGINPLRASEAVAVGADVLVAGSAIFQGGNLAKNIIALRQN